MRFGTPARGCDRCGHAPTAHPVHLQGAPGKRPIVLCRHPVDPAPLWLRALARLIPYRRT